MLDGQVDNLSVRARSWSCPAIGLELCSRVSAYYCRRYGADGRRLTKIYTLNTVLGEWMVETKPITFNHDSLANPINNYILDLESGAELVASPDAFKQAMGTGANGANSVWLAISKRSIRSQVNFSGEKLAKVDLIETDEVCRAVVLTKNGKPATITTTFAYRSLGLRVLLTVAKSGSANFYSLPMLEFVYRLDLNLGIQT